MNIRSVFLEIRVKCWKVPYLTTLKNPSKNSPIRVQRLVTSKTVSVFPCPQVHVWYNFREDLISSFYVNLLTDRQTDKQTDRQTHAGWNITSLAEVTTGYPADILELKRIAAKVRAAGWRAGEELEWHWNAVMPVCTQRKTNKSRRLMIESRLNAAQRPKTPHAVALFCFRGRHAEMCGLSIILQSLPESKTADDPSLDDHFIDDLLLTSIFWRHRATVDVIRLIFIVISCWYSGIVFCYKHD